MKKILSILTVLVMLFAMTAPAFAYEITIIDPSGENAHVKGHTYNVYQIFTGDLAVENGQNVLSNIKFGLNYLPNREDDPATEEVETKYAVGDKVPDEMLEALPVDGKELAAQLEDAVEGTPIAVLDDENSHSVEDLVAGYYLIIDVTKTLPEGETASALILQVVDDVTIASKHGGTTIEKKVKDINDSTETEMTDWQDSADHDIGDTVPFKSTATFSGLSSYTTYKVLFTDTMSPGLSYNEDMKVTMDYTYIANDGTVGTGTKDVTASFPVTATGCTDTEGKYVGGMVYTLGNDDIKRLVTEGNLASATFTLEYSATLDVDAKHGAPGNPNKIKVFYEPDNNGGGETPEDTVIVFTFKVNVDKYKEKVGANNKLVGAGFTLYKFDKDTEDWVVVSDGEDDEDNEIFMEAGSRFAWNGLDDGEYKLVETTTPAGYNTIEPIYFDIDANHMIDSDNPTLVSLDDGNSEAGTIDMENGIVGFEVVNRRGTVLPETGAMGTTLFVTFGSLAMFTAVVFLVTRKKMSIYED